MKIVILIMLLFATSCYSLQFEFEGWTTVFECKDIDNDNDMDIVIGSNVLGSATYPAVTIMRNNGNCNFSVEYIYHPCGFGRSNNRNFLQDVDNDNFGDIVSLSAVGTQIVLRVDYNEDGFFTNFSNFVADSSFMPTGNGFTFGDWNRDNYVDAFFVNSYNDSLFWSYFQNDGNGNFLPYEEIYPYSGRIELADINQDGYDEIILCGTEKIKIYSYPDAINPVTEINLDFNNGFFNFADFDNDEDIDICISSFDNDADILYFSILENLGNYNFIKHYSTQEGENLIYLNDWDRIITKDINGDGLVDLTYFQGVFYNNGNYGFNDVELLPINCGSIGLWGCFDYIDINGDSRLDFLTTYANNAMEGFLKIWFQDSNGNFVEEPPTITQNEELQTANYEIINYPNPFKPFSSSKDEITIEFSLKKKAKTEISVYNLKGEKVKTLLNTKLEKGEHSIMWNGKNDSGKFVANGVYLYKMVVNGKNVSTKKLMILK